MSSTTAIVSYWDTMDPRELELAAEFCTLVKSDHLLSFLGLDDGVSSHEARDALKRKRAFYQSMQNNPKYKGQARFLIKHYRALDSVLENPGEHLAQVADARAQTQLPLLEMAIDSVLADGILDPLEERFIRENAQMLGISDALLERTLRERAKVARVDLPNLSFSSLGPASVTSPTGTLTSELDVRRRDGGFGHQSWWDSHFTEALLRVIPQGTTRMVDLACGLGWGALTLLPKRPNTEYLGIDQDSARLEMAEKSLRNSPMGDRIALLPGSAANMPIPDDAVDLVLCVMSLHTFLDTSEVFSEARRVLRPGGRFVVVEPDRSGQLFYFDRPLLEVNAAVRELALTVDENMEHAVSMWGRPGVSLGPSLGARLSYCGLKPHEVRIHAMQDACIDTMGEFSDRLATQVMDLGHMGRLDSTVPVVRAATEAVDGAKLRIGAETAGLASTVLPAFIAVGLNT